MASAWIWAGFLLVTWRGWRPLAQRLYADLQAAPEVDPPPTRPRAWSVPVGADSRTPPSRVLAFRGVARRVAARRRWEGGFGRKGI